MKFLFVKLVFAHIDSINVGNQHMHDYEKPYP